MTTQSTIIWRRPSSSRWQSRCGRYEIRKVRSTNGLLALCVMFFGYHIHREHLDSVGDEIPAAIARLCEQHRSRVLPQIAAFEEWFREYIATRFDVDIFKHSCGAIARRDAVHRALIAGNLHGTRMTPSGNSSTIGERFTELYLSITPQMREQDRK